MKSTSSVQRRQRSGSVSTSSTHFNHSTSSSSPYNRKHSSSRGAVGHGSVVIAHNERDYIDVSKLPSHLRSQWSRSVPSSSSQLSAIGAAGAGGGCVVGPRRYYHLGVERTVPPPRDYEADSRLLTTSAAALHGRGGGGRRAQSAALVHRHNNRLMKQKEESDHPSDPSAATVAVAAAAADQSHSGGPGRAAAAADTDEHHHHGGDSSQSNHECCQAAKGKGRALHANDLHSGQLRTYQRRLETNSTVRETSSSSPQQQLSSAAPHYDVRFDINHDESRPQGEDKKEKGQTAEVELDGLVAVDDSTLVADDDFRVSYRPYSSFDRFEENDEALELKIAHGASGAPPPTPVYIHGIDRNNHFVVPGRRRMTRKKNPQNTVHSTMMSGATRNSVGEEQSRMPERGGHRHAAMGQQVEEEEEVYYEQEDADGGGGMDVTPHFVSRPGHRFPKKGGPPLTHSMMFQQFLAVECSRLDGIRASVEDLSTSASAAAATTYKRPHSAAAASTMMMISSSGGFASSLSSRTPAGGGSSAAFSPAAQKPKIMSHTQRPRTASSSTRTTRYGGPSAPSPSTTAAAAAATRRAYTGSSGGRSRIVGRSVSSAAPNVSKKTKAMEVLTSQVLADLDDADAHAAASTTSCQPGGHAEEELQQQSPSSGMLMLSPAGAVLDVNDDAADFRAKKKSLLTSIDRRAKVAADTSRGVATHHNKHHNHPTLEEPLEDGHEDPQRYFRQQMMRGRPATAGGGSTTNSPHRAGSAQPQRSAHQQHLPARGGVRSSSTSSSRPGTAGSTTKPPLNSLPSRPASAVLSAAAVAGGRDVGEGGGGGSVVRSSAAVVRCRSASVASTRVRDYRRLVHCEALLKRITMHGHPNQVYVYADDNNNRNHRGNDDDAADEPGHVDGVKTQK